MPERPLILFADPIPAERARRGGGPPRFNRPSRERQVERLAPQFSSLQNALDNGTIRISSSPIAIDPEYTLVFETAGDPAGFYTALKQLSNECHFEWFFDLFKDNVPNDDDFYVVNNSNQRDDSKGLTCKVFCILTNHQALTEILSLWTHYCTDPNFEFQRGQTGFRNVFERLKSVHPWGVVERLEETGILEQWSIDLAEGGRDSVKCEIELFFRKGSEKRATAQNAVEESINNLGGQVISVSCIEEIAYHAILADIPRDCAEKIIANENVDLINLEQIMFFKPVGQAIQFGSRESIIDEGQSVSMPQYVIEEPVVALFDGLPQENHPMLSNLLIVDDPDDYGSTYPVDSRQHGTSMASIILRGKNMYRITEHVRKIYVRPIMKPYPSGVDTTDEYIPDNILFVDKLHECVRRLFEPVAGRVSPSIKVINLSIGIPERLFYNMVSPVARLLDWLSWKYKVLFIVSAGNHEDSIELGMPFSDFKDLQETDKDKAIITALNNNIRNLKLLSPAESMNSLTIGALFRDENDGIIYPNQTMPCSNGMVSPISSLGRGINHSIKPDLLYDGGRSLLMQDMSNSNLAKWRTSTTRAPGILSAKPAVSATANVGYTFGTSDATALISHNASICYETLNEVFLSETGFSVPDEYASLLIKTMLAHGASWNNLGGAIQEALSLHGRGIKSEINRWIGYGVPDISKVQECTKNSVTLIGTGSLLQDQAHMYEIPLPFDFHAQNMFRSLTVTLSYFTPVSPNTQKYRDSQVWFTLDENGKRVVENRTESDDKAVTRGTLQHEHFSSNRILLWNPNHALGIKINCRSDASNDVIPIPYAMMATFEIAPEYDIDVYQRVVEAVRLRNAVLPPR